jgi:hypothetical protein
MKNSTIYIGLGVAALAVVGFFVYRKTQGSAEDMETRSAESDSEMNTPTSATPPRETPPPNSPRTYAPPATTTSAPSTTSSATSQDVLFLAYGISQKDYDKMLAKKTKTEQEADAAQLPQNTKLEVVGKALRDYASSNGISFEGFTKAFIAKNPAAAVTPSAPARRDCRAEADAATASMPRILRGAAKLAYIAKCKREGGEAFAFAFAMDDEQYDMLNY